MSYDLCLLPQAQKPYYIENIRTGIYSLEELCYYLYHNIYLIDESILNEKLLDWIRDELHLPRLYRQLYEQLDREQSAAFLILPIFREAGYLTSQEMHQYQEELARLEVQPEEMKRKLRGDYLVKEKMFARAAWEYRQILKDKNKGSLGAQFYAAVWSNLGAAYAGLFQFSDAADCFWESYSLLKTKETFRKYISTLPLFLSEDAYRRRLEELKTDPYLAQTIQEHNAKICQTPEFETYAGQIKSLPAQEVLEDLKEQYCRSTRT